MSHEDNGSVPQSPEVEPAAVREELGQDQITHVGEQRVAEEPSDDDGAKHMGAVDGEVTPVRAPMAGPDDITDGDSDSASDIIDPADEMTPG